MELNLNITPYSSEISPVNSSYMLLSSIVNVFMSDSFFNESCTYFIE